VGVTVIELGLAAAGLVFREIDVAAEMFEHFDRRHAHLRGKKIGETGDK
jgi:hypothetical protein